jgi:hypothetical protein
MRKTIAAGMLAALAFVAGCGESSSTISGTVTFNGTPVKKGTISFRPTGPGQVFASEIKDGAYSAPNAKPGQRTVEIRGLREFDSPASSEDAARLASEAQRAGNVGANELVNPTDYIPRDAEGNFQVHEIGSGDQTMNFDIKAPMPNNG